MQRARELIVLGAAAGLLVACGDSGGSSEASSTGESPTVVVTTSILGDVVEAFAGEQVEVVTIMPVGADPHDFQPSARQASEMREADVLIVNGAGFEEGLVDVIDAAAEDGTPLFEAIDAVETLEFGADAHGEEHAHEEEQQAEEDGHEHDGTDPHFFTDPARMAVSVEAMAEFMINNVDGIDADELRSSADEYVAELEALDAEVESVLSRIPQEQRILVTNHEVFAYFADRYGFQVVGTVIPGGSTTDAASAGELAELVGVIEAEGVPAIFADTSSSDALADTLAAEVGDVEVVELYSESLGPADSDGATYVAMVRTNSERIAAALS